MSCYHPMILINTSNLADPNQRRIVEKMKLIHRGDLKNRSMSTIVIPRELAISEGINLKECHALPVPCGRCIGCRLDYSRIWAERCVHEASQHQYNYFLTLTYDDDHLPIGEKGVPTLIKDEVSKFMKRLRKYLGQDGIKFFACGEYGTGGTRILHPHYHIILFNCYIPDLQERHPIKVNGQVKMIRQYADDGELLLFSPLVYKAWQERGTAQIGQVTFESCAYVARYIVKKAYGREAKKYADLGIVPEFCRMSRDPGIGHDWFMTNIDNIYAFDNYNIKRGDKVINVKPGKYCDKLLKNYDEQLYYHTKNKRHQDFYDGVDSKFYSGVDLVINNLHSEAEKERSVKLLKRN